MADEGIQQIPHDPVVQAAPEAAQEANSDSSESEAASAVKGRRVMREWELIGSWDPTTENADYIRSELERIATEKMAAGVISKLALAHVEKLKTDLGQWKETNWFQSIESGTKIFRYRCPLQVRCKCPALLKVVDSTVLVRMFMSQMHSPQMHFALRRRCYVAEVLRRRYYLLRSAVALRRRYYPRRTISGR
jgi:hypothetical protein